MKLSLIRLQLAITILLALIALPSTLSAESADSSFRVGFWNTFLGQHPILECWNSASHASPLALDILSASGETEQTIRQDLAAQATTHLLLSPLLAANRIGMVRQNTSVPEALTSGESVFCYLFHYRFDANFQPIFSYSTPLSNNPYTSAFFVLNSFSVRPSAVPVSEPSPNWLSLYNCGEEDTQPTLSWFDANGISTGNLTTQLIPANHRRDFLVTNPATPEVAGLLVTSPSNGCLHAIVNRVHDAGTSAGAGAVVPVSPRSTVSVVYQDSQTLLPYSTMHAMQAWLEVANPRSTSVVVSFTARNSDGSELESFSVQLAGFQQQHIFLNSFVTENSLGYLEVEASATYTAQVLQYGASSSRFWAFSRVPARSGQHTYVPLNSYLRSINWLLLANNGASTESATLQGFSSNGVSLPQQLLPIPSLQRIDTRVTGAYDLYSSMQSSVDRVLAATRVYVNNQGAVQSIAGVEVQALPSAPPMLEATVIQSGFTQPVSIKHSGDGTNRLFIVEKTGRVRVVQGSQILDQVFLDLSTRVSTNSERGLLDIAFPGNFATSRVFYAHYNDLNGDTVVSRFTTSADTTQANVSSEEILLQVSQPAANHNGGAIIFGPDGHLYIGLGDGGGGGDPFANGQNPHTLLGAVLRIRVAPDISGYQIPVDNPFHSGQVASGQGAPEVFAYGIRNPWKMSFDRANGRLFLADVGQNAREEVNIIQPGQNYGWNTMEGSLCYPESAGCNPSGLILPILEYGRDLGTSITGGHVYRGSAHPALRGHYVFGDFVSGRLFIATEESNGAWNFRIAGQMPNGSFLTSFGEDQHGELYAVGITGSLYRIAAAP